jgi:hypothetical protein
LEKAGLIRLQEEKARRGFKERVYAAAAEAFVLDPDLMGVPRPRDVEKQDKYASDYLVSRAADTVREVTRMQAAADQEGARLLTFTIEADVRFAKPQDIEHFTQDLAKAVADIAAKYDTGEDGRAYHLMIGGHPAVKDRKSKAVN